MQLRDILRFYDHRGYGRCIGRGSRPALIVIDFSQAFTAGRTEFPGGDFAAELDATQRLIAAARPRAPVIFTTIAYAPEMRDAGFWAWKVPWLAACQQGSTLVEIDRRIAPQADDLLVVKKYPSAFFGTDLDQHLRGNGVDTLLIAGCTTSVCVRATALDAMQHGYRPLVVRQAVGDFDPAIHALHLADIGARYADIVELPDMLHYLQSAPGAGPQVAACPS